MKQRIAILITIAAFFVMLLTGCFANPDFDFDDASSIEIMTADMRVKVTDADAVAKITADVEGHEYERVTLVGDEAEAGYIYTAYYTLTWYNSDGVAIESIEITETDGSRIAHDAVVYTVLESGRIDIASIDAAIDAANAVANTK